jgi:hypothetical protein
VVDGGIGGGGAVDDGQLVDGRLIDGGGGVGGDGDQTKGNRAHGDPSWELRIAERFGGVLRWLGFVGFVVKMDVVENERCFGFVW